MAKPCRRGSELAMTVSLQPLSQPSAASSPSQGSLLVRCVGVDVLIDPTAKRPVTGGSEIRPYGYTFRAWV